MSLLFLEAVLCGRAMAKCGAVMTRPDWMPRASLLFVGVALSGVARAGQSYFIPEVGVTAEQHTNRELISDSALQEDSTVYRASLAAVWGWASQRGKWELRPRGVYQKFTGNDTSDRFEGFGDLTWAYDYLRGSVGAVAHYSRQDVVNAEAGTASFDPSDPENPGTGDSGIVQVRGTRTRYDLEPGFEYELSERSFLAGRFQYQAVRYDANLAGLRVGFDSPYGELTLGRSWLRTRFSAGPYFTRYDAVDGSNVTDTAGGVINIKHDWSELSNINVALRAEHNDCSRCDSEPSGLSRVAWGLELVGYRRNPAGALRYGIGRFLVPSSLGERRQQDQIRLQYSRALNARLSFNGAVRFSRDRLVGSTNSNEDRDRAFADVSFTREMTRTLLLTGGYRFIWQDLQAQGERAHDQTIFLQLVYRGLQPQGVKETR